MDGENPKQNINHICNNSFGRNIDFELVFKTIINKVPKGLSYVDKQILMSDLYDIYLGVFNHLDKTKKKPLASVEIHFNEDTSRNSYLERSIRVYKDKIRDTYNLSLLEYLSLPSSLIPLLVKISNEEVTNKGNELDEIKRKIEKESKK